MNSGYEYSAALINKTVWGEISQAPGGKWLTTWRFQMDTSKVSSPLEVKADAEVGFTAMLHIVEPGMSILRVLTSRPAMSAEYYPLTFSCFRIVNDEIGAIETIEDLPRDWYAPFRSRDK
jgi:hypothetical protein